MQVFRVTKTKKREQISPFALDEFKTDYAFGAIS
jgi:hypothetical protein